MTDSNAKLRTFEPSATEGQRAKVLVDVGQQLLRLRHTQRLELHIEDLGVVTAFHVLHNQTASSAVAQRTATSAT